MRREGRRKGWDRSFSRSSQQPAVDGEMIHVGIGALAVLKGIFLVFSQ